VRPTVRRYRLCTQAGRVGIPSLGAAGSKPRRAPAAVSSPRLSAAGAPLCGHEATLCFATHLRHAGCMETRDFEAFWHRLTPAEQAEARTIRAAELMPAWMTFLLIQHQGVVAPPRISSLPNNHESLPLPSNVYELIHADD